MLNLKYYGAVVRGVEKVLRHPDYSGTYWDVALLYLDEPLPISNSIQPISLPLQSQPDPGSLTRVGITSQGWGYNEDGKLGEGLEKIDVNVRSKSECDFMYSNNLSRLDKLRVRRFLPDLVSSSLFCADNNLDRRIGTCNGDSGGPSVIRYSQSSWSPTETSPVNIYFREFVDGSRRFTLVGVIKGSLACSASSTGTYFPDLYTFVAHEKVSIQDIL